MKAVVCRAAVVVLLFWQGLSAAMMFRQTSHRARFELAQGTPGLFRGHNT